MSDEYDRITAEHYAAYRPPLHQLILSKCLNENQNFASGLDVGCGTGFSTIALSSFCKKVIGIDPATEMLVRAIDADNVSYAAMKDQEKLSFDTNSFF